MSNDNKHVRTEYFDISTGEVFPSTKRALEATYERKKQEQEQKEKEQNPEFIQFIKAATPEIVADIAKKSGNAIAVLMFFYKNMDDYNVLVVSQSVIAEITEINIRSVARAINLLEKKGVLAIGKVGNANVYILNPYLAWQKRYNLKGRAIMKAKVIFGKDESDKLNETFKEVAHTSRNSLKVDDLATKISLPSGKEFYNYD